MRPRRRWRKKSKACDERQNWGANAPANHPSVSFLAGEMGVLVGEDEKRWTGWLTDWPFARIYVYCWERKKSEHSCRKLVAFQPDKRHGCLISGGALPAIYEIMSNITKQGVVVEVVVVVSSSYISKTSTYTYIQEHERSSPYMLPELSTSWLLWLDLLSWLIGGGEERNMEHVFGLLEQ